jgi:hypothetical protein
VRYIFHPQQFRVNVKDNVIKNNQIFAHALGFRANIDLLQPVVPEPHRVRRREVYETLEELINQLVHVLIYSSSWYRFYIFDFIADMASTDELAY